MGCKWVRGLDLMGGVVVAMPQRDETIEEIKRLDALLEYAVMNGDEATRGVAASLRKRIQ